jgi:excisionase family DNA binding protein
MAATAGSHTAEPGQSEPRAGYVRLPKLVGICEIADHLGVSVRHVRRLVAERRIPYLKWGNLLRFDPEELSRWLAQHRVDPFFHSGPDRRAI